MSDSKSQKMNLRSPPPRIRLRNHFRRPMADAVSAAKTCYSNSIINPNALSMEDITRIGQTTYEGGHHTVYQHEMFEFELSNVSRSLAHDFLHNHPFYNSSQNSQRYVRIDDAKATVPPITDRRLRGIFRDAVLESFRVYDEITQILVEELTENYRKRVSASRLGRKVQREIREKAIEAARYALSIAAHTHLIHTIDGVTLWRYYKMKNISTEANTVVEKMVKEVKKIDPSFFALPEGEGAYSKERMPEVSLRRKLDVDGDKFAKEFDDGLEGRRSKLVSSSNHSEEVIAESVRHVLGVTKDSLADDQAIDMVLNPANNHYLIDTLNLSIISPISRVLQHAQYTFKKRISHTADSQDQRHRTIPASRSLTPFVDTKMPDYIVPEIIKRNKESFKIFGKWMDRIWDIKNGLLNDGVPIDHASYLLPNARIVRFEETGSLLNLWYKFTNRSCLRAEEEIWQVTMDEIEQVKEVNPSLGKYLGPPCFVRKMAHLNKPVSEDVGKVKYCNQGKLYCRQPVWNIYPQVSVENVLQV